MGVPGGRVVVCLLLLLSGAGGAVGADDGPIRLDPENPHYLNLRGRPTLLVGSGEHYGAVLNLDFDYEVYLDAVRDAGLNLTRTFSGTYREVAGSFGIQKNTLAPAANRYQAPWKKVADAQEGKPETYDLDAFDPAYFERLDRFVRAAAERGIVVELVLFCPFYEPVLWDVNPMNAQNNVNGVGTMPREEVYTLKHPELLNRQLAFVREVVTRLNDHDNLYYEICNEPYAGPVAREWQSRIAEEIAATEARLPKKHLIAENFANGQGKVEQTVHPEVDIVNFHYAEPEAVLENYGLNRALGDDETGFEGNGDRPYRSEAWRFLLSGGAIFSNLDYSFTVDSEDGTAEVTEPTPGGGGPRLRKQLRFLKEFLEGMDFVRMRPEPGIIVGLPDGARAVALVEQGRQYAIYGEGGGRGAWSIRLPRGRYALSWFDPVEGRLLATGELRVGGETEEVETAVAVPVEAEELVLKLVGLAGGGGGGGRLPRLRVSENRRFLVQEDGAPFFYLGDTAWELFHRLNREETITYLDDRAAKGFNVIQAVVLAELDGLNTPSALGERPLHENDPSKPNEAYFRHVDWVVEEANRRGLYVGLLPTWGDKVNKKWGVGPEIFTPENARVYGQFLGRRYRDRGIIWILGGDRPVESNEQRAIWDAMAAGLRAGDGGAHRISYHPMGGQSSHDAVGQAEWIDFHMIQSGHSHRNSANYDRIAQLYALEPAKPCLDAEPCYEDHPVGWKPQELGWFDAYDVRKAVYWSVFAGGCGVTYGCHDIWQFMAPGRAPVGHARNPWRVGLKLPGSAQMQHLKNLMLSRPYLERIPDAGLVVGDLGGGGDRVQATRARDGSYGMIYVPRQRAVTVDLGRLAGSEVVATWYSPRDGSTRPAGRYERSQPGAWTQRFEPPGDEGPDWVLVIDEAARGFAPPGQVE
ncbi:MAG: hypothetical protein KatS3mg108_3845 [Isosphaeraceae bacterium]|jgi:hypothetical protein|nr:MAG: hypothetical protein KatS3mg108_3845 [Isosphaeraceae bacterium]